MRTLFYSLLFLLSATLLLPHYSLADNAVYLPKGSVTPFEGYLFDQEKAEKVRNLKIDYDTTNRLLDNYKGENAVIMERLANAQEHNKVLAQRIVDLKDDNFFNKVGYFVLGAVVTGVISYGVVQTLK